MGHSAGHLAEIRAAQSLYIMIRDETVCATTELAQKHGKPRFQLAWEGTQPVLERDTSCFCTGDRKDLEWGNSETHLEPTDAGRGTAALSRDLSSPLFISHLVPLLLFWELIFQSNLIKLSILCGKDIV